MKALRRCTTLLLALALGAFAAAQDELGLGRMWTFHDPPLAWLQQQYGFTPDQQWFDHVRLASLRFCNKGSASFVSPRGLILTDHHCVRDAMGSAQGAADWVRDGFVAATLADEVRLPNVTVQQLVAMRDVTARMDEGIDGDDAPEAAERRRCQNEAALLAEARKQEPQLRPQVVRLFQGASCQLYQYRVFDDVRLVMAPHLQIANFGGDPDNFVYPRYAIDFAFCRAWVDGKPADTAATSFRWSDGPQDGQLVILCGNPQSTQRLLTKAQLEYLRDVRYPRMREMIDHRIAILRDAVRQDPGREKLLRTRLLGLENVQKGFRGEHEALLDPAFLRRKEQAETAFRSRVQVDARLQAQYGDVWQQLAEVAALRRQAEPRVSCHSPGGSALVARALLLVEFARAGDRRKADKAREIKVTDPLQLPLFADHLERARRWLPADDPYLRAALDGLGPQQAAARLAASRVGDDAFVDEMLQGGRPLIEQSDDPALRLAWRIEPLVEAARAEGVALDLRERALDGRLARALFAAYGHAVAPEATFTLRFADGRVCGYDGNGTRAPWRTVLLGLFARAAEFDGAPPFDLPAPWLQARKRLDLQTPVDFVCTVDAAGGNSGSPVIDTEQRVVGLLFDGNFESLGNEFVYGESVERSICVHPRAIMEALTKVYGARRVADELRAAK